MKKKIWTPRRRERGMALVAVTAVVLVMIALAFALSFSAAVNLRAARNAREAMRQDAVAASALSRGMTLLREDGEAGGTDTLLEAWAGGDIEVSVDGEACRVWIEDEERKLNVNLAARKPQRIEDGPDLEPALRRLLVKCGEGEGGVDAIRDWLWPAGGADGAPGGALLISDLQAVPGLSSNLFVEEPAKPSLASLAGTRGARLNVNTAREETLEALWNDAGLASQAVARRKTAPFENTEAVAAFLREAGAPVEAINAIDAVGVASEYFTISARRAGAGRVWRALVRRQGARVEVIHVSRSLEEAQ